MTIAGTWQGTYFYDQEEQRPADGGGVDFQLILTQSRWQRLFGRFSGSVTDDPVRGMPGTGKVSGSSRSLRLRFRKSMPAAYVSGDGGRPVPMRQWLADRGYGLGSGREAAHDPVFYAGTFTSPERASGTWWIRPSQTRLAGRLRVRFAGCTGTWVLRR